MTRSAPRGKTGMFRVTDKTDFQFEGARDAMKWVVDHYELKEPVVSECFLAMRGRLRRDAAASRH
jgi:hypothetical protein